MEIAVEFINATLDGFLMGYFVVCILDMFSFSIQRTYNTCGIAILGVVFIIFRIFQYGINITKEEKSTKK